jgi:dienelactone hydrolase
MKTRFRQEVEIAIDNVQLKGDLFVPEQAEAIVIFSHGSGSSRHSVRNRAVAGYLQQMQIGTLLFDLLTEEEDQDYSMRFDIDLLRRRLVAVTRWLEQLPAAKDCRIGYFGASTGAASALMAAAVLKQVGAVVSRGGRPDMAAESLPLVEAPTLLIVGSLDTQVLALNRMALEQLTCTKELAIVEGATHLFEEYGTLDEVMKLASAWFEKYLRKRR